MRIYSKDLNKLINRLEISLTQEEAEDFYFRINDLPDGGLFRSEKYRIGDLEVKLICLKRE